MRCASIVVACSWCTAVWGQPGYVYEMRLFPDVAEASPGIVNVPQAAGTTTINFWLQARVMQNSNQNWGIYRAGQNGSLNEFTMILVTDSVTPGFSLRRAPVNPSGTQHGRGPGYRSGGVNVGPTGNAPGDCSFPNFTSCRNGALDALNQRIWGFECVIDQNRQGIPLGSDGEFVNPYGVNGTFNTSATNNTAPVPWGVFSPWANLYRFSLILDTSVQRDVQVYAQAHLWGTSSSVLADLTGLFVVVPAGLGVYTNTNSIVRVVPSPAAALTLFGAGLTASCRRCRKPSFCG